MTDNYPAGAKNDSRAPWNQEEPTPCVACNGIGYVSWCCDAITQKGKCTKCLEETESTLCPSCKGNGNES